MRTFRLVSVLSVGLLGAVAACSGGGDTSDGGSDSGADVVKKDASNPIDAPVTCTASDTYSSVTNESATYTPTATDGGTDASADASADANADADDGSADASADADDGSADASAEGGADASADAGSSGGANDVYTYQGDLNSDVDVLDMELYAGYGVFTNGIKPGTYQLSGAELDYATCGLCVLVYTDTSGTSVADSYMATGGTVTISSLSGTLTGTLSNVTFTHVDINSSTFESTPVGDGCNSSIPTLSISAPIQ